MNLTSGFVLLDNVVRLDDSFAHSILLGNAVGVNGRDLHEKELRIKIRLELLDVEIGLVYQRHVDGGLEIRLSANLPEFFDGHLVLEGDQIIAPIIFERMERNLKSDIPIDPRIVRTLDSNGGDVVVGVRILFRDHGDGLLDLFHVQEGVAHASPVDLEFLRIQGIAPRILGDDEFDLRHHFLGLEIPELLEIPGGAELASNRASAGNRDSDHPAFIAASEISIVEEVLLPSNGILRVEGKEGVGRLQRKSILGVEQVDGAVCEVLAGLFGQCGHWMSPC